MRDEGKLHLGCSGWSYQDWVGPFYPKEAQPRDFLKLYSSVFNTVELDSSFYRIPNQFMISLWRRNTPNSFVFAVKYPKKISHDAKLQNVSDTLSFFYRMVAGLENKLGPLVLQLPPSFKYDSSKAVFEEFLSLLDGRFRHAVEFRHKSWFRKELYDLLSQNNVSLCWSITQYAETPTKLTADFIYARMVGDRSITKFDGIQKDTSEQMQKMNKAVEASINSVDDAFVFFNNHFAGFGPESVNEYRRLAGMMELDWSKQASGRSSQRSIAEFSKLDR